MESREQFEEWITKSGLDADLSRGNHGCYLNAPTHWLYCAWKASRESLVIELPSKISECNTSPSGYVRPEAEHYDEAIDDCREAIHAAGVRTK